MTLKRGIAPKTVRRRSSSPTGQETKVARLAKDVGAPNHFRIVRLESWQ